MGNTEFSLGEHLLVHGHSENSEPIEGGSELRQDIVTGDWVVVATTRSKRPSDFADFKRQENDPGVERCPFEYPEKTNQEKDTLIYQDGNGDWSLRVFPNKYPAFIHNRPPQMREEGPYFAMTGMGYHEVIVTRDHYKHLALLKPWQVSEVLDAYQDRYLTLMKKKNVRYVQVIHNHGKEAGASIAHPHSQLLAFPVISPYIQAELSGAERYWRANRHNVYKIMSEFEIKHKQRIVFENDRFIAFCPFASRSAFEVWVMPKYTAPYFERLSDDDKMFAGEALQNALFAIYKALGDPSYNFYLHTSPCDGRDYPHFQWHIEILPHTATWAGFELSTGVEIISIQPEMAAEHLRSIL